MKKLLLLILCFGATSLWAQEATDIPFNGLITGPDGKGVKARITVQSTHKYTIADKTGKFGLTNVGAEDSLIIRYRRDEITLPVAGRKSLKIVWQGSTLPQYGEDNDLVNIGFGYVKRREYADSSTGITGAEMLKRGYTDVRSAILGMIPGITWNGGFLIRGATSINANANALVLCDGMEVHDVNSINIHDIKSVEVQKGNNMYGLRGANGVILITTR